MYVTNVARVLVGLRGRRPTWPVCWLVCEAAVLLGLCAGWFARPPSYVACVLVGLRGRRPTWPVCWLVCEAAVLRGLCAGWFARPPSYLACVLVGLRGRRPTWPVCWLVCEAAVLLGLCAGWFARPPSYVAQFVLLEGERVTYHFVRWFNVFLLLLHDSDVLCRHDVHFCKYTAHTRSTCKTVCVEYAFKVCSKKLQ